MMCLFCINATIIMAYIKIVLAFLKPVLNRPAQVLLQGSSPCDTQRHICWTYVPGWSCWHLLAVSPIPWNFLRMGRGRSKTDIAGGRRRIPEAAIRWRIRFRAAGRGKYRKNDAYPEDDSRQSSREENPWYDLKGLDEVEKTLRLQMEITTHGSMNWVIVMKSKKVIPL